MNKVLLAPLIVIVLAGCRGNSARDHAHDAYEEGVKCAEEGQYEKAVDAFTRAAKDNPKNYGIYVNRANAYDMLKQNDKALADYNFVIAEAPQDKRLAEVYYNRGYMHQRRGEKAKAIVDYQQALRLDPKIPDAREHLAELGVR